jgi:acetylornithine deacetylase/succinyl-diaminopimelate desuccinylase-like protein
MLFGPGDPEIAHTANESVDLDEVLTAAQFYALLGQRMLTPGTGNGEQGTE